MKSLRVSQSVALSLSCLPSSLARDPLLPHESVSHVSGKVLSDSFRFLWEVSVSLCRNSDGTSGVSKPHLDEIVSGTMNATRVVGSGHMSGETPFISLGYSVSLGSYSQCHMSAIVLDYYLGQLAQIQVILSFPYWRFYATYLGLRALVGPTLHSNEKHTED